MLMLAHCSILASLNSTLCSIVPCLAHPRVLQCEKSVSALPVDGRQIGRTKSDGTNSLSNFNMTTVLPSTGDFLIPIT
uniref:Putative secreted protein n=1 Tax=Panstrongylus lignarius TaxID=156445 RepID=A0A224XT72_9HEMI